jgi:hypothetical protein
MEPVPEADVPVAVADDDYNDTDHHNDEPDNNDDQSDDNDDNNDYDDHHADDNNDYDDVVAGAGHCGGPAAEA